MYMMKSERLHIPTNINLTANIVSHGNTVVKYIIVNISPRAPNHTIDPDRSPTDFVLKVLIHCGSMKTPIQTAASIPAIFPKSIKSILISLLYILGVKDYLT